MILLCTLNARYIHSALGLRYLYANMGSLQQQTQIQEFTINQRAIDIAEIILQQNPSIVGIGCYIWNIQQVSEVLAIIKSLRPDIVLVLGGPEISFETAQSNAYAYADYIIRGQGDLAFSQLCRDILDQKTVPDRIIDAEPFHPNQLALPYDFYTDEDIRQRVLYVEASRGCPFKCEFCLSALDKTAQPFVLDDFLQAMEKLYQRGARHFKFVDRTFNLNIKNSQQILQFFLTKPLDDLFLHFELIPDRLPDELKALIEQFPDGALQFEIGIQTFNPQVQQLISRKQDHDKTLQNLNYLSTHTRVHLHTDLIGGLPGEDINSFAKGFDLLVSLNPQEIQLGILKRLRGTPITRHTEAYRMIYNPYPPYEILSTADMDAATLFRLKRFARYWDMLANSGRFEHALPILLADQPFDNFMQLSDWLFHTTWQTHNIALPRLFKLLYDFNNSADFILALQQDFEQTGNKSSFTSVTQPATIQKKAIQSPASRQQRHVS